MNRIVVSIIIPLFNQEQHITQCLESVQGQDFTEFEALIIDDGSTDTSLALVKPFLRDSRFRLIQQKNSGAAAARNTGIRNSKGSWIAFVDSDDFIELDYLKKLLSIAKTHPECDIIASSCYAILDSRKIRQHFFPHAFTANSLDGKLCLYKQLMNSHYMQDSNSFTAIGVPWGKLYRRRFMNVNNLAFDTSLRRLEDNAFNMKAFSYSHSVLFEDYAGYNYRVDNLGRKSQHLRAIGEYRTFIVVREKLLQELSLLANPEIQRLFENEKFEIISSEISSAAYESGNTREINKILIKKTALFSEQLKNTKSQYLNTKNRFFLFLLRKKRYLVLTLLFRIKQKDKLTDR